MRSTFVLPIFVRISARPVNKAYAIVTGKELPPQQPVPPPPQPVRVVSDMVMVLSDGVRAAQQEQAIGSPVRALAQLHVFLKSLILPPILMSV
jgi:hypothetical protein